MKKWLCGLVLAILLVVRTTPSFAMRYYGNHRATTADDGMQVAVNQDKSKNGDKGDKEDANDKKTDDSDKDKHKHKHHHSKGEGDDDDGDGDGEENSSNSGD